MRRGSANFETGFVLKLFLISKANYAWLHLLKLVLIRRYQSMKRIQAISLSGGWMGRRKRKGEQKISNCFFPTVISDPSQSPPNISSNVFLKIAWYWLIIRQNVNIGNITRSYVSKNRFFRSSSVIHWADNYTQSIFDLNFW